MIHILQEHQAQMSTRIEEKMKINLIEALPTYGQMEQGIYNQESNPNTVLTPQPDTPTPINTTPHANSITSKATYPVVLKMLGTLQS